MKLIEIKKIQGKIRLKSGLHIGSGNMEMHIGGTDSPVIKHPHTLEPYIPGSSLKGKVRSLLEMESGLMMLTNGDVISQNLLNNNNINDEQKKAARSILKLFGSSGADSDESGKIGPTRASFSDCYLNNDWKSKAISNRWQLTEVKSENRIDRIRGTAEHPRFIERVPEGTEFDFLVTLKVLGEDEEEKELFNLLIKGLKLLEMDAIGGSGSRGYGRLEFIFEPTLSKKFNEVEIFSTNQTN